MGAEIGKMLLVKNTTKLQASKDYYRFVIIEENGVDTRYMFTEPELASAKYRAGRHMQDWVPKRVPTLIEKVLRSFLKPGNE